MKKRGIAVSPNIKPGMLLVHPLLREMMDKDMFIKADPELPAGSPGNYGGYGTGSWWGGRGVFVDYNLKTRIDMTAGDRTVIRFTHTGDYPTAVTSIHLDAVHREKSPFYVRLDGETIPHFLHRKKFEAAETGWYYTARR